MSYDVYLMIDTGGDEPVCIANWNYTSNCAQMWRHAGADLPEFDKAPCSQAAGPLAEAVERMRQDPDTYHAMNPPNGWGDYDSALKFLAEIAEGCARHPKASLWVSW